MEKVEERKQDSRMQIQMWGIVSLLSILFIVLIVDYTFRNLDYSYILYVAIPCVSLILSVAKNLPYIFGKNQTIRLKDKMILLVANSCSGSPLDILFIFMFIVYCAWIPDAFMDFTDTGELFWRPIMFIVAFMLTIVFKPSVTVREETVSKEKRKVLFTGVSGVTYSYKDGKVITNLEPVIQPIIEYPNISKIVILLSDAISVCKGRKIALNAVAEKEEQYRDIFEEYKNNAKTDYVSICEQLSQLIRKYIKKYTNDNSNRWEQLEFEFTNSVDYNDFEACNDRLVERVSKVLYEREKGKCIYRDENLLFNITPGTAIVSGVMTLNAIKGNRGLIYTRQESVNTTSQSGKIEVKEYNPNVIVLDQQILELMTEKIEQQNS